MQRTPLARRETLPPLENGDHLDQKTFHQRYEAMPGARAELIGGVVFMSSPMKTPHGRHGILLARWLSEYEEASPGTEALGGATSILSAESEPEPDACLIITAAHGGQTWEDEDGYLNGAPEWVGEISDSSESIDLHAKKRDYEQAGVREYFVAALRMRKIFWFVRRRGKFKELHPDRNGALRSEVFPGLWLDRDAFLDRDRRRLLAVLHLGLASPEHAAFVAALAAHKSPTE